jgi:deoxyribonucleoside regulator
MTISNYKQNLSEEENRLCIRVAMLYFENNLTQDEIGKLLGYSRVKINRVLRQARESGIVEIRIHQPDEGYFRLEDELMQKYSLRDVRITPDANSGSELYLTLARGATNWLNQHLEPGICVGIGLGRTVSHLPQVFHIDRPIECTFTEVVGAASENSGGLVSYNVTSRLAELAGGKAELFYAPTFVSDPELKRKLLSETSVITSLQRARNCQIVIQSVGPVDQSALLYNNGQLNEKGLADLKEMGAIGDAMGHYFDINGTPVPCWMDEHIIGIDLEDLWKIPWSVLIAGGAGKVKPIDSALKGKLFNVLITNLHTAQTLLKGKNITQ